jgi:glycosyltransferase involved in cell wall biosynthesis
VGFEPLRVWAPVIANGFQSEARVFAHLLSERADDFSVLTAFQDSADPHGQDAGSADLFEAASHSPTLRLDFGWRRNDDRSRSAFDKARSAAKLLTAVPAALKSAATFGPHLVYSSQQRWDCTLAALAAYTLRVPQVVHLHYLIEDTLGPIPLHRLRHARGVVTVSEFIADQARAYGVHPDRIRVIPNTTAVPPPPSPAVRAAIRSELGLAEDVFALAIIARVVKGKGHADTLEALARCLPTHPRLVLLVAGDGPLLRPLMEQAARLGIAAHVRFLGFRADVPRLLQAIDAFIHPSMSEPFGLSILEACAARLPVIAYRDGGPQEILVDGETGFLVPPLDIDGLARSIRVLCDEPALRAQMGLAGMQRVAESFNPTVHARSFAAFLRECAGQAPPEARASGRSVAGPEPDRPQLPQRGYGETDGQY